MSAGAAACPGFDAVTTGVAGAADGLKTAGLAWWRAHDANSSGCTVYMRMRMFAWLAPQYSVQKPFHAELFSVSLGVNQR